MGDPFFSGTGADGVLCGGCGCGEYAGADGVVVVGVVTGTEAGAGVELGVCVRPAEAMPNISAAKKRKPLVPTPPSIPKTQLLA